MDLQSRKIAFVQAFLKLQNEAVITQLENVLHKEKANVVVEDFQPMAIEAFNARIDQSMEDSKNGRLIEASQVKANIEKWT